ncbi:MAG: hypothetical protein ACI9RO_002534, partial [Alteromonas macleodii]
MAVYSLDHRAIAVSPIKESFIVIVLLAVFFIEPVLCRLGLKRNGKWTIEPVFLKIIAQPNAVDDRKKTRILKWCTNPMPDI